MTAIVTSTAHAPWSTALWFLLTFGPIFGAVGQADPVVIVEEGQTLRDLAETHLGDPNLWPAILEANGLRKDAVIEPGTRLRIPRQALARAEAALTELASILGEATENGARLFAEEAINHAINFQRESRTRLDARDWTGSLESALAGLAAAREALDQAMAQRKAVGTALLHSGSGTVQSQRPGGLNWQAIDRGEALVEREKVRTLSNSRAVIVLTDQSRLSLEANSTALIREMRVDHLLNRHRGSVSLMEGDVFALLQGGAKDHVNLEIPGLELKADSENYWVSTRGEKTRIANYDSGSVELKHGTQRFALAKGQGASLDGSENEIRVFELLPAPELGEPTDESVVYAKTVVFSWKPVADAKGYHLEIAEESNFAELSFASAVKEVQTTAIELGPGSWFWRVRALDDQDVPGPASSVRGLRLQEKRGQAYLAVFAPVPDSTVYQTPIILRGRAQSGARLTIAGEETALAPDGAFAYSFTPTEGLNEIVLQAVDATGAATRHTHRFIYRPDTEASVTWSGRLVMLGENHFLTRQALLTLVGETRPDCRLEVFSKRELIAANLAATYSNSAGWFQLTVPVSSDDLVLRVTSPSGKVDLIPFRITRDNQPPEIEVVRIPPAFTSDPIATLTARVDGAVSLWLNDEPTPVSEGDLQLETALIEGSNTIQLRAEDRAGNLGVWSRRIILDTTAPIAKRPVLSTRLLEPGQSLEIRIGVSDRSGLRRTAQSRLQIGGNPVACLLFREGGGLYRGVLVTDRGGPVRVLSVTLEDQLGNRRVQTF